MIDFVALTQHLLLFLHFGGYIVSLHCKGRWHSICIMAFMFTCRLFNAAQRWHTWHTQQLLNVDRLH